MDSLFTLVSYQRDQQEFEVSLKYVLCPGPEEESEFFISANFNLPNLNLSAELLRFLKVNTTETEIFFGAGIFVDISKDAATRKSDDAPGSIRHGRLTREMMSKMPVSTNPCTMFVIPRSALDRP